MYILFLVLFSSVSVLLSAGSFLILNTQTVLAQSPTITLEAKIDSQNSVTARDWNGEDATIVVSDQIHLRWNSRGASRCVGSADSSLHLFDTGGYTTGTDISIYEPEAGNTITYTITCTDGTDTASDSITVTKLIGPTATLERKLIMVPGLPVMPSSAPAIK